jgi:hypothetical protein
LSENWWSRDAWPAHIAGGRQVEVSEPVRVACIGALVGRSDQPVSWRWKSSYCDVTVTASCVIASNVPSALAPSAIYSGRPLVLPHLLEGFPDFPLGYVERPCLVHRAPPITGAGSSPADSRARTSAAASTRHVPSAALTRFPQPSSPHIHSAIPD